MLSTRTARFVVINLLILSIALSGCGLLQPSPTPTIPVFISATPVGENDTPVEFDAEQFEVIDCPFGGQNGGSDNDQNDEEGNDPENAITCGYLTVPAIYEKPDQNKIRLFVVILKTRNKSPQPDPIVFNFGFPMSEYARYLMYYFDQLYAKRDLIIFDPRGVGASEPALVCPMLTELFQNSLVKTEISTDEYVEANRQCRAALKAQQENLNAFNVENSAQDLRSLRQALGYREWNIIGNASGAAQALEVLRTDSQGVRSMLLVNTIPPAPNWLLQPAAAQEALHQFFQLCVEEEKCNDYFPNTEALFYEEVEELNNRPLQIEAADLTAGKRYQVTVTGDRLLEMVLAVVDEQPYGITLGELPRLVAQLKVGKTEELSKIMGAYISNYNQDYAGLPTYNTCLQILAWSDGDIQSALSDLNPAIAEYYERRFTINQAVCEAWGPYAENPVTHELMAAPVPVFFLAGENSWQIPRQWTDELAAKFTSAQIGLYPHAGVNIMFSDMWQSCTKSLLESFINEPGKPVDMSCLAIEREITWITLP